MTSPIWLPVSAESQAALNLLLDGADRSFLALSKMKLRLNLAGGHEPLHPGGPWEAGNFLCSIFYFPNLLFLFRAESGHGIEPRSAPGWNQACRGGDQ